MTKSEYLSNSAKLLMLSSALLLLTNGLVYLGQAGSFAAQLGSKLSTFSFYVVLVMGFLAFNGEGIAYKRSRDYVKKKRTTVLKFLLVFAFLFRYIKKPIELFVTGIPTANFLGVTLRVILGVVNTTASYGFILMLSSLWFLVRDSDKKSLFVFESISFLCGVVYNAYKLLNLFAVKYDLFGTGAYMLFSSDAVLHGMCLVQFFSNALMCLAVMLHYNKLAATEQEDFKKAQSMMMPARRIYNTDCVGIDTLDDDYGI